MPNCIRKNVLPYENDLKDMYAEHYLNHIFPSAFSSCDVINKLADLRSENVSIDDRINYINDVFKKEK